MRRRLRQIGQGMTEYIIIVALIALAAIAVYQLFGETLRSQMGGMAQELAGQDSSGAKTQASEAAKGATEAAGEEEGLDNYGTSN